MSDPTTFFEPKAVNDHFVALCGLRHPSGDENELRQYVADQLSRLGITDVYYVPEARAPGERVIRARRPGRPPYHQANPVVLQAHLDMVAVPHDRIFPLTLSRDPDRSNWLRAQHRDRATGTLIDTSLGADDGIGVAVILGLLAEPALQAYPLEALFTVQEETDMGGARDFAPSLLSGRRFLNLDSETLDSITCGSAGGNASQYRLTLARTKADGECATVRVAINGLAGGHSGVDINKGRANAVRLLAEALRRLDQRLHQVVPAGPINAYDLRLVGIGQPADDTKTNVIPSRASALVRLPAADADSFISDLKTLLGLIRGQWQPVEAGMGFEAARLAPGAAVPADQLTAGDPAWAELTPASTDAVLNLLTQVPCGALGMIPHTPEMVETSANLVVVQTSLDVLTLIASNRSASELKLKGLALEHAQVGARAGATVTTDEGAAYPPWSPHPDSAVLAVAEAVYQQFPHRTTQVLHAGLECGWVVEKYRDDPVLMDCISIGPTVVNVHSTRERLDVTSVPIFYQALVDIIHGLFPHSCQKTTSDISG